MANVKITGCVFDLDGTLADTAPDISAALNAALMQAGLRQLSYAEVTTMIGGGIPKLVERAIASLSAPQDLHAQLVASMLKSYTQNYCVDSTLLTGVEACLAGLQARAIPMAVCTNKDQSVARKIISAFGLDDYFVCVVGSRPDLAKKPDPTMLREAIMAIGCRPEETMMVGDSDVDAQTASATGCVSVIVQNGYFSGDYTALGADYLTADMTPVLGIIDTINGRS
jgi:phosphoglycolate phosphatase